MLSLRDFLRPCRGWKILGAGVAALFLFSQAYAGEALKLSLKQAMQLAQEQNVAVLLSSPQTQEALGELAEANSLLSPRLSVTASQSNNTQNLAALGFPRHLFGIGPLIGPYNTFDARFHLAQTLFNESAVQQSKASSIGVDVARLREGLSRESAAQLAALAYINVLRAEKDVVAVQYDVRLAQSLHKLARDQHASGIATGLDVARAKARLSLEEARLDQVLDQAVKAEIKLKRALNIPLSDTLDLTDKLKLVPALFISTNQALDTALHNRLEMQIAQKNLKLRTFQLQAAKSEGTPSVQLVGDYGLSGNTVSQNALPTRSIGVQFSLPVFNGGLTHGHLLEAESKKRESEILFRDTQAAVEEDVRLAESSLEMTAKSALAARDSRELAGQELKLARDRFAAGVADNLEVTSAQASLEEAEGREISALADYAEARLNLKAALGKATQFDLTEAPGDVHD